MFSTINTSMLIILMFGISTMSAFEFIEKENHNGLIFVNLAAARVSYDSFKLVYHINLTEYKRIVPALDKAIAGIFFLSIF